MSQLRPYATNNSELRSGRSTQTNALTLSMSMAVVAQVHLTPSASNDSFARSSRPNLIIRIAIALVGGFMALTAFAVVVGRVSASAPTLGAYPTAVAPGQNVPLDAACVVISFQHDPTSVCTMKQGEQNIILNAVAQHITSIIIEVPQQRIGDLITTWGDPIAFSWSGSSITVSWSDRSAHLVSCTFSPSSAVSLIEFRQVAPIGSPWRGFVSPLTTVPCRK